MGQLKSQLHATTSAYANEHACAHPSASPCRYCLILEHCSRAAGFDLAVPRLDILLQPALLQYQYVICYLADLANLRAAPQAGALALCAACWKMAMGLHGIHSVYVDFCFKLVHLAAATRIWSTREPPNSRFFLPGKEVRDFQKAPSSMQRVEADKDCSDFKAAEAVARRCGKVGSGSDFCVWCDRLHLRCPG